MKGQEEAADGVVDLLELFPSDTKFYLNTWTWGYETVLKAIARRFATKVSYLVLGSSWSHSIFRSM